MQQRNWVYGDSELQKIISKLIDNINLVRYASKKKPKKCSVCGTHKIATYLCGMPVFSEIEKDLNDGKFVLGGCCISDIDPDWQCISCNIDIYITTIPN